MNSWIDYFLTLAEQVQKTAGTAGILRLRFMGEDSTFVRFNHGLIRQSGEVRQATMNLHLVADQRQMKASASLSMDSLPTDLATCLRLVERMKSEIHQLPEDPYIPEPSKEASSSRQDEVSAHGAPAWSSQDHVADILKLSQGMDMVGIYAAGQLFDGYQDNQGNVHTKGSRNFNFDYSIQLKGDKAVKRSYAGNEWQLETIAAQFAEAKKHLSILDQAPRRIDPGSYRVYLSPAAVGEILQVMSWGGFSLLAHKSGRSALQKLYSGAANFSPLFSLWEEPQVGPAPQFNQEGLLKPKSLPLIVEGKAKEMLVSSRSAKEFAVASNGADTGEHPSSLVVAPGSLPMADVLEALGTGLLIGNLWYLNYSDLSNGQITGMTRFATYWVEKGKIVAPLENMRFDDSLFSLLGDELEALTQERELSLEDRTYESRQRGCNLLPGLLLKKMRFTL
jgi:predicted Zn-dependent protease